jgi:glycosyltransferase involved in cell wall biosynthesis
MVGAYAKCVKRLKDEGIDAPKMVLGGRLGWYYDEILERIKSENIEDNIKLLGYVDENEKPELYKGALAFVFPSLYEGFGLPIAEAMACATPVLTSNSTSLAEIAGDAAICCDALSEDDIAEGMYRLAVEKKTRKLLSEKGPAQVKQFSWDSSADQLYKLYEEVLSKTPKNKTTNAQNGEL